MLDVPLLCCYTLPLVYISIHIYIYIIYWGTAKMTGHARLQLGLKTPVKCTVYHLGWPTIWDDPTIRRKNITSNTLQETNKHFAPKHWCVEDDSFPFWDTKDLFFRLRTLSLVPGRAYHPHIDMPSTRHPLPPTSWPALRCSNSASRDKLRCHCPILSQALIAAV